MSSPVIPNHWKGSSEGETWDLEIEHDRFKDAAPFVVSLYLEMRVNGGRSQSALATATPEQAREMASALMVYAFFADKENR